MKFACVRLNGTPHHILIYYCRIAAASLAPFAAPSSSSYVKWIISLIDMADKIIIINK